MFKILNNTNKENVIKIQGAKQTVESPFATLLFQNYDLDTRQTYDMAGISCYDHFADSNNNGLGDLVFRTNGTGGFGGSNVEERMRIMHNGDIIIGSNASGSNSRVYMGGTLEVGTNIVANELSLQRLNANTKRILFGPSNSSDSIISLSIDASNIVSGTIDSQRLPINITLSNIVCDVTSTNSLYFGGAGALGGGGNGGASIGIYAFQDWSNWISTPSNVGVSNASIGNLRYRRINSNIDIDYEIGFVVGQVPCDEMSFACPLGVAKYTKMNSFVIVNNNTNALSVGACIMTSSTNNIICKLDAVSLNNSYNVNGSLSYEMA
jgi:hypothetical protein